ALTCQRFVRSRPVAASICLIYFEVARVPERGWLLAAAGLVGKVLGPIGLLRLIWNGTWPFSTIILSVTNDLIWWPLFALYLRDSWPAFRQDVLRKGNERATL
ncbi:MAG TPA: hypothetical protein DCK99_22775, partial [Blastocatellia bacterium]|nr:hypothetical protein [Blastocatellia bacterium]